MALVQERADVLSEILLGDQEQAKHLLTLSPEDALTEINALGHDFTVDEIKEYGDEIKKATEQGELDADSLDDVSGGSALVIAGACGIAFVAGAAVGGLEKAKIW